MVSFLISKFYDAHQPGPSQALTPAKRWERYILKGMISTKNSPRTRVISKNLCRVLNQTPSFLATEVSGTTLLMNVSYLLILLFIKLSLAYTLFLFFYFK